VVDIILDPAELEGWVAELREGKKYRSLSLPDSTLQDLILQELPRHKSKADAMQAVRKKLHNLVAPYLGDPDYQQAEIDLRDAFQSGSRERVLEICLQLLESHASTRERIPFMEDFYRQLFTYTGKPQVILDLACGLNPFAIPWMNLDAGVQYHAFDIHQPRVQLINSFLQGWGCQPLASQQDILVEPPRIHADAAFFFKEAHRFEQRQHGCNRAFWQALDVKFLLVSLPTRNLTGQHSLLERQRSLVHNTLKGLDWKVEELIFQDEMVFCIQPGVKGER
jgi:16S rRNA (guanine(1405)-N(7))-methyltransferase